MRNPLQFTGEGLLIAIYFDAEISLE